MIPKVFLNQSDASEEAVKELTIKAELRLRTVNENQRELPVAFSCFSTRLDYFKVGLMRSFSH